MPEKKVNKLHLFRKIVARLVDERKHNYLSGN